MQVAARDGLTAAQITTLIEAENVQVTAGLELLDSDDTFIEDISDDLLDGIVDRGNYRTIHGTCSLRITRELVWGNQRVKPYLTLSTARKVGGDYNEGSWDAGVWGGETGLTARFDLGVFLLTVPERRAGETPLTFDVDGFDKLEILSHPHGTTYSAAAGDAYLTLVEALITGAGESKVLIDQTEAATTLPTGRVWPIDEGTTTLNIINDLLAAIGYRALWADENGYYRSEPYKTPADRGSEWTYSADSPTTTVAEDRVASANYTNAPNRIIAIRNDPAETDAPTEGAGIVTLTNQSDGLTSIDARGRTITDVVPMEAASQSALAARANQLMDAAKRFDKRLTLTVSPNPLHLHFDVVTVTDAQLSLNGAKYLVTDWSLPLGSEDMTLEMRAV